MARSWIIDSRGFAKKVKNSSPCAAAYEIKDCGASTQCPYCHCLIDNSDVSCDWPGFPVGVKFDPSDGELLDHLAAKCGVGEDIKPHLFIDEFIPTLEGDEGICYTHPENLPGAKKDGSSVHFFYKISYAYTTGKRKRRKIQGNEITANVRWHKTGKTKVVMENGIHKGHKKIMVLYSSSKGLSKSEKRSWVMHQFHLGSEEEEKEGEFVVAKIFYQPQKESGKKETSLVISESDVATVHLIPKTPNASAPEPPREEKTPASHCGVDDDFIGAPFQDGENYTSCLAGESQDMDLTEIDFLTCDEIIESYAMAGDFKPKIGTLTQVGNQTSNTYQRDDNFGISDLLNIELDTAPDFMLSDLQFPSQDSLFDWVDRL